MLTGAAEKLKSNAVFSIFDTRVDAKKYEKMCIILFKIFGSVFKLSYQTAHSLSVVLFAYQ